MADLQHAKSLALDYVEALESASGDQIAGALARSLTPDCQWRGVHPFNEAQGPVAIAGVFWAPLKQAMTHLRRHQDVFMAGENDEDGSVWVMSMGYFAGLFDRDWLGIPAHRKLAMLRYTEFLQIRDGRINSAVMFCDILDLMQQVGIQALPPQTGAQLTVPGPSDHAGLLFAGQDPAQGALTLELVNRMVEDLAALNRSGDDSCPPALLERSWHPDMRWYGPAGIGSTYTIERYQEQHQRPFRQQMRDKVFNGHVCRFAEGNFACFFGWANLSNTPAGGFLGLPGGMRADMRVVDVYRRSGDRLLENWVLIDLLYWLKQQGVDVLARTAGIMNPPRR
ncbi:MAG: nuclear transport factor 2 family protein [Chromatocurvus sp.]